jgi:hypothetical protein
VLTPYGPVSEIYTSWFAEDDLQAISVKFEAPMYAEDRKFKDERPELFRFHGSTGFMEVSLVKLEPGQFQEMDIILLLQRIFSAEQIYHSPRRVNDGEEICDVFVILPHVRRAPCHARSTQHACGKVPPSQALSSASDSTTT